MKLVVKVDGIGIMAHSFNAMKPEKQAEEMASIATAHGKDEAWAEAALAKVTEEYAKAVEAEIAAKEKQNAAKAAMNSK